MKVRAKVFSAAMLAAAFVPGVLNAQSAAPPAGGPAPSPPVSADISRADALKLVEASLADCVKRGYHVTGRVWDASGNERIVISDDGAPVIGIGSSIRKANTVMQFKASTLSLGERAKTDPALAEQLKDPKYYTSAGGLPLYKNGKLVGILALGGGRDQDGNCAMEGIKAVPWVKITP